MPTDPWWQVLLLIVLSVWAWESRQQPRSSPSAVQRQRLLLPRTPDDCSACRRHAAPPNNVVPRPAVTPWPALKSRRGAMGRIATQPFACPNRRCTYYRITDAQVHALVGDGTHGRCERIQTLRESGVWCHLQYSARYPALSAQNRISARCRSADGPGSRLSIAAAVRVFEHRRATITTWLTRPGAHSVTLHERFFRRLHLPHLQFDELRTRLRNRTHVLWLSLAIDPLTKIMVVLQLDPRTQAAAHAVVHELHGRLASGCLPVLRGDGLNPYFYALSAHFGQWVASVGRQAPRWLLRSRTDLRPGQETREGGGGWWGSRICYAVGRARRFSRLSAHWA